MRKFLTGEKQGGVKMFEGKKCKPIRRKLMPFAAIMTFLLSGTASAETEFSLGGFVKLQAFWDSTQDNKNMSTPIARNNNPSFHHGRMKFTAQGSRFSFTIKGPKLFGAQTTGFIEMDFNSGEAGPLNVANSASNSYIPVLRHAMFRFNWPATELLFGQYWSMFCAFYPETIQDGPLQGHGMPMARLAQVRLTQKLGKGFSVAGLIGQPTNSATVNGVNYTLGNNGENAESPQIQGKLQYQQDLWGKAAYYGRPMPFTVRIIGGWQRNVARAGAVATTSFGQNNPSDIVASFGNHQYLNPWMIMGNAFLPVIPTHSANLAGTAALNVQWYIGQGLGAFGENMGPDSYGRFAGAAANGEFGTSIYNYILELFRHYGGYVQAQYYFTNHWFANVTWGMSRVYGVSLARNAAAVTNGTNAAGFEFAGAPGAANPKIWQEVDFNLWYRPITAIKFGLQYSWQRTDWFQVTSQTGPNLAPIGANTSRTGNAHRVQFGAFFFF
jgi:hypothetical protein